MFFVEVLFDNNIIFSVYFYEIINEVIVLSQF